MQNRFTVLIAEPDAETRDAISSVLQANGYLPLPAENGAAAVSMISSLCPDVVLLAQELPDMEGLEVLKKVRSWTCLPILILSSHASEKEEVRALDMGADDYIRKPFGYPELLARIRMAQRHSVKMEFGDSAENGILKNGDLVIDLLRRIITIGEKEIHLTQNEYRILLFLAKQPGKVLTYEEIIKHVWGHFAADDRQILRVNIANIRKKIEADPADPKYILTEIGIGYRMALAEGKKAKPEI
jgi:two-component system KDP operon response regulator KdpE